MTVYYTDKLTGEGYRVRYVEKIEHDDTSFISIYQMSDEIVLHKSICKITKVTG